VLIAVKYVRVIEFRCKTCRERKLEELRKRGVEV